jgi:hypothetical protein
VGRRKHWARQTKCQSSHASKVTYCAPPACMNCHNFSACSAVRCPWSDPGPTRLIPTANLAIPLRAPQPNISSSQVSLVGHPAKQPRWSNGATASISNGGTSTIGAFGLIYGSCYASLLANGSSGPFQAAVQILNVSTMKALGMLRRDDIHLSTLMKLKALLAGIQW